MEYLDTKYFSYADPDDPIHRKALIRSIEYVSGQPYPVSYTHLTLPTKA